MAETFLEQHSEVLVDGLRYEGGSKASSIQERREITVWPSGSSTYDPVHGRVIKFVISDMSGFVLLNTIRLQCQVKAGATAFYPLGSLPHCLVNNFRLIISGTVVENLDSYTRLYNMMEKCLPRATLAMNSCENTGLLKPYGSTSTIV